MSVYNVYIQISIHTSIPISRCASVCMSAHMSIYTIYTCLCTSVYECLNTVVYLQSRQTVLSSIGMPTHMSMHIYAYADAHIYVQDKMRKTIDGALPAVPHAW